MDVMKLMKRLNGNVLANKARVVVDGKIIIIGRLHGQEWVPTDQGVELEKELNTSESNTKKADDKKKADADKKAADKSTKAE